MSNLLEKSEKFFDTAEKSNLMGDDLAYFALALVEETQELATACLGAKKHNVISEIGDLLWYLYNSYRVFAGKHAARKGVADIIFDEQANGGVTITKYTESMRTIAAEYCGHVKKIVRKQKSGKLLEKDRGVLESAVFSLQFILMILREVVFVFGLDWEMIFKVNENKVTGRFVDAGKS